MNRFVLALSLCGLVLWSLPASLQAYPWRMHKVQITYSIKYDDDVQVRTMGPPPSAIRAGLTPKELQALRDPGLPGYRAKLSDIGGSYVTIYLERVVVGASGVEKRIALPPAFCQVHHNYGRQKYLCLLQQQMSLGNSPPPYLIGNPGGGGIPLPGVRLKRIVIHSSILLPSAGGGLIR